MMTFTDLLSITNGKVQQLFNPPQPVRYLLTDSRKGIFNAESVFFAIPGVRHDGHRYMAAVYARGVRQFVVEQKTDVVFPEANIVQVPDAVTALQQIVAHHRQQFSLPLIGITGSNGKTIVKEWLAQLLSPYKFVAKSPKSYNSQLGVPLSVWLLQPEHEIGIFEAGISRPGEMERLESVIQPSIGVFTNVGPAHDEGFQSREQKVQEKAILFRSCRTIIYCANYPEIDQVLRQQYKDRQLYVWSAKNADHADLLLLNTSYEPEGTRLELQDQVNAQNFTLLIPFHDEASIENSMHCIAYMLQADFTPEAIRSGLKGLRRINMRMELKQGINHCYLLDDSYSNDFFGLQLALDFLGQQQQNEKQTAILSDLLQTGQPEELLYEEVKQLLLSKGVSRMIGIGKQMDRYQFLFRESQGLTVDCFPDTETFLQKADFSSFHYENILIKGARTFGFEQIVRRLQQKIHGTTLEINLDALTHNLNYYRSQLRPGTKMMVMVKAFSYGGAAFEIASHLQFHQVDYLAVAYADEGIMLRENGIHTPILVLNPSPDSFDKLAAYQLEPEIYSLRMLHLFLKESANWFRVPPVHLKIDTGMHRLGFEEKDMQSLLLLLKTNPYLRVGSIFSHLAAADEPEQNSFTREQVEKYTKYCRQISEALGYVPLRHILNSAGILRFPDFQMDMVRLGIGLYGVSPCREPKADLRPVSTLKTVISQIKQVKKGESVGYSRKGKVTQDMTIATIAIGYADGLDRGFSNGNLQVFVKGKPAPVIGNICMDMTMVDISGIKAEEGEEVIIFGEEQSVQSLADRIGTIPYEILTNVSERVKRVFYTDA